VSEERGHPSLARNLGLVMGRNEARRLAWRCMFAVAERLGGMLGAGLLVLLLSIKDVTFDQIGEYESVPPRWSELGTLRRSRSYVLGCTFACVYPRSVLRA
jgi:hypothetical protein